MFADDEYADFFTELDDLDDPAGEHGDDDDWEEDTCEDTEDPDTTTTTGSTTKMRGVTRLSTRV
jgi:hypothetical protein